MEGYLTVPQAAALLGLSLRRVRELATTGAFPGTARAGERVFLIPQAGVDAYQAGLRRTGKPGRPAKGAKA